MGKIIWKSSGKSLAELKQTKLNELNQSCNDSILSGFDYTINGVEYHFSFDMESQFNFQGAVTLLDKDIVQEIEWTVMSNGNYERIMIDKSTMNELMLKILQHKDSNIKRFRNQLMPLVDDAQSKEQLDSIEW
jgi:ABC-type molybdenum transport system ATPase subunit/photorepair protein PhrA